MSIRSITLETPDPAAAQAFHAALDVPVPVGLRMSSAPTSGFRGFTLSLLVPQPSTVDALVDAAQAAGAAVLKPVAKSFWGYGGVVAAPDGSIWKVATSSKKEVGAGATTIDDVVLLLGVEDVKASKRFYVEHGLTVKRSFGSKYVEFDAPASSIKLALYRRRALAEDAGVPAEGTGSHRIAIGSDGGSFTDPDGFAWEPSEVAATA
jgi:predicted lactoylglutathione lyase